MSEEKIGYPNMVATLKDSMDNLLFILKAKWFESEEYAAWQKELKEEDNA